MLHWSHKLHDTRVMTEKKQGGQKGKEGRLKCQIYLVNTTNAYQESW